MGISPRRAFERLTMDIIHGQQAHFVRHDELAAAWRILTPLLNLIDAYKVPMYTYKYGSRGPVEAEALRAGTGHRCHSRIGLFYVFYVVIFHIL